MLINLDSSVIKTSLILSLVFVVVQVLKREKTIGAQFNGMGNVTKISNSSLLTDVISTYGKWLTDIKTFFEKV